jgi:hypothetical protein
MDDAQEWNLFNQHWTCQLVPTVPGAVANLADGEARAVREILRTSVPGIGGLSPEDLQQISYH